MSRTADFAALFETAACGLMEITENGTITTVNQTFCGWVGRGKAELLTMKLQNLLSMGGRIFHETHWDPLLRMQGSVSEVKIQLTHASGERIPMVMNASRRSTESGIHNNLAFFIARDRDKYEAELVKSQKSLEATVAEARRLQALADSQASFAEQLMGIASHDLRNPLSTIIVGCAVLGSDVSPKQQITLSRISRAGERANRLISDLLDFTQAKLGRGLGISPKYVDVKTVVGDAVEELRLALPEQKLVHVHQSDGHALLDPDRFSQMLGNLVANAAVYGQKDASITITSSGDAHGIVLEVHNCGPAIPAHLREEMFEPMVRGLNVPSNKRSVGLGLFIVSEIVKAHGGRIELSSEAETGTTFRIFMPESPPT
jgi:sigma-B regulation protein RsbU (phosphoserine phosphatase)